MSTNNAPTGAGTMEGGADTPSTGISAFPNLSRKTEQGEVTEPMEDGAEDIMHMSKGGGTAIGSDVAAPAEERAGLAPANLEDLEKLLDLATQQSTKCNETLIAVYGDTIY